MLGLVSIASFAQSGEEAVQLKDAPARGLTVSRCVMCHSLDYIQMNAAVMNRAGWERSVRKMIDRFGAPISDDEARQIIDYLATQYPGDG
jgi:cytochrome c5